MKAFDDLIRRKLDNLDLRQAPDWNLMEQRLQEEQFDDILRQSVSPPAFEPLHSTQELAAWERLEATLNHENELAGEAFDKLLSQKLVTAEMRSESQSVGWRLLSTRMDTFWTSRRRWVRSRMLELAAAVGLLISFAPLLNHPFSPFEKEIGYSLPRERKISAESATSALADLGSTQTQLESSSSAAKASFFDLLTAAWSNDAVPAPSEASASISPAKPTVNGIKNSAFGLKASTIFGEEKADIFRRRQPGLFPAAAFSSFGEEPGTGSVWVQISVVEMLGGWQQVAQPENTTPEDVLTPAVAAPIPAVGKKAKGQWQLGLGAGISRWMIRSAAEQDLGLAAISHQDQQFRADLHAIYKPASRLGIAFGLGMSQFGYQPDYPTVISPLASSFTPPIGRSEQLESINVLNGQAALSLRYDVLPKGGRDHVWVSGGAVAQVALRNRESISADIDEIPRLITEIEASPMGQSLIADRNFSEVQGNRDGLFEGGGLNQNLAFAALAGLEYEREINSKTTLFASAMYQHHLGSRTIGNNGDQTDALHFSVGARLRL